MLKVLLRDGPSPHRTAVAMVGARGGDRVLVVGVEDAGFETQLAQVTGLTGEVRASDSAPGAAARVEAAVQRSGSLVEFDPAPATKLPFDRGTFDVVVINRQLGKSAEADRAQIAAEAVRVVKPGGRVVVIEAGPSTGLFARWSKPREALSAGQIQQLLSGAGCRATRLLAESSGVTYVEALTSRTQTSA